MQENDNLDVNNEMNTFEEPEPEPGFSDKLVGVLSAPGDTFKSMAMHPAKVTDWLIPILLVAVFAIISTFLYMSNPELKADIQEKQMKSIQESFEAQVESGSMTEEEAEKQFEKMSEGMDQRMEKGAVLQSVSVLIWTFVLYFIIATVFFIVAKFILKGDGNYQSSLVAYGLPQYIVVIQVIIILIVSMMTERMFTDTSIASFIEADKKTITGFILAKLDPLRLWFYFAVSVGYAKMFKSESNGRYYVAIFGIWLGFGILIFALSQFVPFLSWMV